MNNQQYEVFRTEVRRAVEAGDVDLVDGLMRILANDFSLAHTVDTFAYWPGSRL